MLQWLLCIVADLQHAQDPADAPQGNLPIVPIQVLDGLQPMGELGQGHEIILAIA